MVSLTGFQIRTRPVRFQGTGDAADQAAEKLESLLKGRPDFIAVNKSVKDGIRVRGMVSGIVIWMPLEAGLKAFADAKIQLNAILKLLGAVEGEDRQLSYQNLPITFEQSVRKKMH